MERQIQEADFVLMLCTETYCRRVKGEEIPGKGHGVRWEGNLIRQHLYNAGTLNTKFIPVLLESGEFKHIPTSLQGTTFYSAHTEKGYEDLYRHLTNQPGTRKPELGKRKELPPRQRQQDFSNQEPGLEPSTGNRDTSTQQQKNRRDLVVPILVAVIGTISTIAVAGINKLRSPPTTPLPVPSSPNQLSPTTSENQPPPVVQPTEPGSVDAPAPIVKTPPTFSLPAPEQPASPLAGQSYFKPCTGNTNNVFVASGFDNRNKADAEIQSLRNRFPQFRFKLWYTVAPDGVSNGQYAVIVGHGLNQTEAQALVKQVKSAGVTPGAYSQFQSPASPCKDLSGVER
jgi:hypothetical protein